MITSAVTESLTLTLAVTDVECVGELSTRQEGEERDFFALAALRVGILALRQAAGVVDRQTLSMDRSKSLLAALNEVITDSVRSRNEAIIQEFTLDNEDSALSRLVRVLGPRCRSSWKRWTTWHSCIPARVMPPSCHDRP